MNFDELWIFLRSGWKYQSETEPSLNLYKAGIKHTYEVKVVGDYASKRYQKFTIHTLSPLGYETYYILDEDGARSCKNKDGLYVSSDEVYDSIINFKNYERQIKLSKLI